MFDESSDYTNLEKYLNGKGVRDINRTLKEMKLEPVHNSFNEIFSNAVIEKIIDEKIYSEDEIIFPETDLIKQNFESLIKVVKEHFDIETDNEAANEEFENKISNVFNVNKFLALDYPEYKNVRNKHLKHTFQLNADNNYKESFTFFIIYDTILHLEKVFNKSVGNKENSFVEKLLIDKPVTKILQRHGKGEISMYRKLRLINILLKYENLFNDLIDNGKSKKANEPKKENKLAELLNDKFVYSYIGATYYKETLYFSKEGFEELIDWLFTFAVLNIKTPAETQKSKKEYFNKIISLLEYTDNIKEEAVTSSYKLETLKEKFVFEEETDESKRVRQKTLKEKGKSQSENKPGKE